MMVTTLVAWVAVFPSGKPPSPSHPPAETREYALSGAKRSQHARQFRMINNGEPSDSLIISILLGSNP
jgi:hypothetical protein